MFRSNELHITVLYVMDDDHVSELVEDFYYSIVGVRSPDANVL